MAQIIAHLRNKNMKLKQSAFVPFTGLAMREKNAHSKLAAVAGMIEGIMERVENRGFM